MDSLFVQVLIGCVLLSAVVVFKSFHRMLTSSCRLIKKT